MNLPAYFSFIGCVDYVYAVFVTTELYILGTDFSDLFEVYHIFCYEASLIWWLAYIINNWNKLQRYVSRLPVLN